jgi:sec-independent protein translocase protein TatC
VSESTAHEDERPGPEDDVQMTIWEHLAELRMRVTHAALALLATTVLCWVMRERLLAWIVAPYEAEWAARFPTRPIELQTLAPIDTFMSYLELAVTGGVILASPVIFWQLWAFVSPGLYAHEKRYIVPFVVFSTALFGGGVAFGYYVAFPFSFQYFLSLLGNVGNDPDLLLIARPTMEYYLDFTTRLLLAFGGVFELPLFIAFLAMAGIVTPRQLVQFSRYAVVAAFVIGGVVTPGPEVSSQIAVSAALIALYFVSVGASFLVAKRRDT